MIANVSPSAELFLANLNRIEQQITEANTEMSSGRKVNVAADDPSEIQPLLQLRTNLAKNQQISSNLGRATTDAQAADSALAGAATLLDSAVQLAAQGANDTQTADMRATIAQQVESIMNQMVTYSQTQVDGRYIFSGDQDGSPTYRIDLAAPNGAPNENGAANGVDELSDAAATRTIENPAGGSFAASKTAHEIFNDTNSDGTPAADNVFAGLNALRTALLKNDQPGIANALASLKAASDHVNTMAAFFGTVETRIQDATSYADKYGAQLQTEIGQRQDADPTATALALTQASTQLQAAMTMQGHAPNSTLFDYLG